MRVNHVLIDYENVQPAVADALAPEIFRVWVFLGAQQAKVKVDLLDLVQRKGTGASIVRITSTGRNALDFHMSYYLGQLATQEPDDFFHVVAKDTGMDPLIEHLKGRGLAVARWADVFDIPVVKAPSNAADEDKLNRILEYLVQRGKQRPAKMKTLIGSVASLFNPKLGSEEAARLVEQLRVNGVFETVGTKVKYGLPD